MNRLSWNHSSKVAATGSFSCIQATPGGSKYALGGDPDASGVGFDFSGAFVNSIYSSISVQCPALQTLIIIKV